MSTPPDPAASPSPGPRTHRTAVRVPGVLRTAAAYARRLIAVGVVVRAAFSVLGQFHRIAVAAFLGLILTAVLRPAADLFARFVPRVRRGGRGRRRRAAASSRWASRSPRRWRCWSSSPRSCR